ncbi:uncharacterized protein FRV6_11832 [Fusarium oxysporum]|uniref:Uncharacterized protein n=1 Tax=Fusarium oxysporum TaxID=5507 RepID=A0A2H3TJ47_FUSOX|nr:uncharacterized protein FRV6_11832 [Fusarium oxysporum]
MAVAEAEASIQTVGERHAQAGMRSYINIKTLPKTHPLATLKVSTSRRYLPPLKKLEISHKGTGIERMETIQDYAVPPWHNRVLLIHEHVEQMRKANNRVRIIRIPSRDDDLTMGREAKRQAQKATRAEWVMYDVAILTWADSTKEACKRLQDALNIAERWAATHASIFAPDEFQLTHFTRTRTRMDINEPLQTRWGTIEPKRTCKYLGLTMDTTFTWKQHIDEIQRKVSKTINAFSSLGGSTWGITMREMRKIYKGVAVPQMIEHHRR